MLSSLVLSWMYSHTLKWSSLFGLACFFLLLEEILCNLAFFFLLLEVVLCSLACIFLFLEEVLCSLTCSYCCLKKCSEALRSSSFCRHSFSLAQRASWCWIWSNFHFDSSTSMPLVHSSCTATSIWLSFSRLRFVDKLIVMEGLSLLSSLENH